MKRFISSIFIVFLFLFSTKAIAQEQYMSQCVKTLSPDYIDTSTDVSLRLALLKIVTTVSKTESDFKSNFSSLNANGILGASLSDARKKLQDLESKTDIKFDYIEAQRYAATYIPAYRSKDFIDCVAIIFSASKFYVTIEDADEGAVGFLITRTVGDGETRSPKIVIYSDGTLSPGTNLYLPASKVERRVFLTKTNPGLPMHVRMDLEFDGKIIGSQQIFVPPLVQVNKSITKKFVSSDEVRGVCGGNRNPRTIQSPIQTFNQTDTDFVFDPGTAVGKITGTGSNGSRLQVGSQSRVEVVNEKETNIQFAVFCQPNSENTNDFYWVNGRVLATAVKTNYQVIRPRDNGVKLIYKRVSLCSAVEKMGDIITKSRGCP